MKTRANFRHAAISASLKSHPTMRAIRRALSSSVLPPPSAAGKRSASSGKLPPSRWTSALVAKCSAITPTCLSKKGTVSANAISGVRVMPV